MKKSLVFTFVAITALIIPSVRAQSTAQIAQALVGMTATNGTAPCVGDGTTECYGIPSGAVAIQPDMLPAPGATPTWYAVFQTAAWAGNLSVTFELLESGVPVQSATGSATAAQNSTTLVTVPQTVPSNGYSGPATLSVTTTATPTSGGTPFTLRSAVEIEVGASPKHQVVIALAGYSQGGVGSSTPCIGGAPDGCYGVPLGVAVLWPQNVWVSNYTTAWYAIFQAGNWRGTLQNTIFTLTERGNVVMTYGPSTYGGGPDGLVQAGAGLSTGPHNGYMGTANLAVAATAVGRHGSSMTKLKYNAPLVLLPPAAQ